MENQNYEQAVFISYAWEGESEQIVDQIDRSFKENGLTIIRDKRDLPYKGPIKDFMERLGRGNCVIVVLNDKYLRSPNCMFELVEISENKQFADRIFPIVLANADIYKPARQAEYIKYWEDEIKELKEKIKNLDPTHLEDLYAQLNLYDRIRGSFSQLTATLSNMNALTPDKHLDMNFEILYGAVVKRIQEGRQANTVTIGSSEKVAGGLVALRDLMQHSSDVKNAVIEFQTDFRETYERVDQLGDYKDIHDLLHQLQFSCYNGIIHEAPRFIDEDEAFEILSDHVLTFENIVDELRNISSRPSMPKQELRWIDEVEQMKADFRSILNTRDDRKLKMVIGRLNRLLGAQPGRINILLTQAAGALRLDELCRILARICNGLPSFGLDPARVNTFQGGLDGLNKLEKVLSNLVDQHGRWQDLESDLRLSEPYVGRDLDQLEIDWSDIKSKSEQLYFAIEEGWANDLRQDSHALDEALAARDPARIRRCFRNYQRRVANRFYQVDLELKTLCGNLRQIGAPLASVLEAI